MAAVAKPEKTLSAAAVEKVVASAEPISQPQPATEPMTPKMEPSTSVTTTTTTGEVPHAVVPMGQDPTATQPNATADSKSRLWLIVAMAAGVALFLYFRKK
ncbi:MAG: hypothetical protein J6V54_10760 [Bacteroidales bacterium]|nr:hypothetical protein [Bacteroidales bacterium]